MVAVTSFGSILSPARLQDDEPSLVLILSIDGKEYVVEANAEKQIPGAFENAKVKIRTAGYRVFRQSGLSFRYPQEMEYSFEHDGSDKTWSLGGDDADLDVMSIAGDASSFLRDSIKLIVAVTDKPEQEVEIKSGKRTVNGFEVGTHEYRVEWDDEYSTNIMAIELPIADGKSRVLMFSREYEDNKLVEECVSLEKMVLETLKLDP